MDAYYYELSAPQQLIQKPLSLSAPLGEHDVLAKTCFSAISPGTELAAWLGMPPLRPSTVYPRLQGYCNVAEVLAVGSSVTTTKVGDTILTNESHRSGFVCAANDILFTAARLPATSQKQLAATYLYHLAYVALLSAQFSPGHEVAIIGLGTLGLATASLVKLYGLQPWLMTNQTPQRFREYGFTQVYAKEAIDQMPLIRVNAVGGADIVINTSNAWADHLLSMQLVRPGGQIICLGFPGRGELPPNFNPLASEYFYDKQLTIKHCGYSSTQDLAAIDVRFTLKRNCAYLANLILNHQLDPNVLLNEEMAAHDLAVAYQLLAERKTPINSILLSWV